MNLPTCQCTSCGHILDAAAGWGDHPPKPGDLSICIQCGHLAAFGADLRLRELTAKEMWEAAGREDLIAAQRVRYEVTKRPPSKDR